MDYGHLFANLAYAALRREEEELATLVGRTNLSRRPLSVGGLPEPTLHFLITKEALSHPDAPRIAGEFSCGREIVDLGFVRELDGTGPVASFELKIIFMDVNGSWQKKVRWDISKHLDPVKHAKDLGSAERYNCLFVVTEKEKEDIQSVLVKKCFFGFALTSRVLHVKFDPAESGFRAEPQRA